MKKKLKQIWDNQVWVLWRSSRGRSENVLRTSRIKFPGTSLERQIKTSPGAISGHPQDGQTGSLGESWGRWRGTCSGRPGDNFYRLGSFWFLIYPALLYFVWNRNSYNSENMGNNWVLIVTEMYEKTQTFESYGFLSYFMFGINP